MLTKGLILATLFTAFGAHAAGWEYETKQDKMTSAKTSSAEVGSTNSLDFGFPYKGPNYGTLLVRQHPQHGLDVLVAIQKGQMLCPSYSGCSVQVRFDDAKPVQFTASGPADHSSTVLFIRDAKRFIASATKAKQILVQFNAYQQGSPVLEFATPTPLVWPAKAHAK